MFNTSKVKERLKTVHDQLVHMNPKAILVCVCKKFSEDLYDFLYQNGERHFAENYIQEAIDKRSKVSPEIQRKVTWHFIGRIQSNKINTLVEYFDVVHSLDSLKHAKKMDAAAAQLNKVLKVMINVNLAQEDQKSGIDLKDLGVFLQHLKQFDSLQCIGLMTFPPLTLNFENNRTYFCQLRQVLKAHKKDTAMPSVFDQLSMGVSNDYGIALEEGASMIRLGSTLFGDRHSV